MRSDLALRIEGTDPRLLLPQGASTPDRLSLVDALELPSSGPRLLIALLIDAEGHWHALPLIDDSVGLRRARAGDGLALAAADWIGSHRAERQPAGFGARDGGSPLREKIPARSPGSGMRNRSVIEAAGKSGQAPEQRAPERRHEAGSEAGGRRRLPVVG